MKLSHKIIFFTNSFSIGIMTPVLSLVLLTHGANLKTLSICIGILAFMIVILELPSGILTDFIGRKRIYLLSCFFMLCNFILIFFSRHLFLLAIACAFQGIGRAFSSGSIEVLEIESYMKENGESGLPRINNIMSTIECAGLALGSLCGGLLGYIDNTYKFLLVILMILRLLLLILTILFVEEKWEKVIEKKLMNQIFDQLHTLYSSLKQSKIIVTIFIMSIMLGLGLSTVEIYWQPTLKFYLPTNLNWIFGIINCLAYLGVILGNNIAEKMWNKLHIHENNKRAMFCYFPLRLVLTFPILALGLCRNIYIFILLYFLIYTFLGAGNLFENSIFHSSIDNSNRASMVSLSSLFLRSGGILTSILGSLILKEFSLSNIWIFLPTTMGVGFLFLIVLYWKKQLQVHCQ